MIFSPSWISIVGGASCLLLCPVANAQAHFCAGAQLARLEASVAFEMMFARFHSIQLNSSQPVG